MVQTRAHTYPGSAVVPEVPVPAAIFPVAVIPAAAAAAAPVAVVVPAAAAAMQAAITPATTTAAAEPTTAAWLLYDSQVSKGNIVTED